MNEKVTQDDLDKLADIIWWIKGYIAGAGDAYEDCPFSIGHIESLRKSAFQLQPGVSGDTEK